MPRRHITCQWNRQAARLIRNKCSAARPRGLTSGSARWLTSRAVGHVAASGLRLGGEQKRTWYGPDTCWFRTPPSLDKGLGILCPRILGPCCEWPGPHKKRSGTRPGGLVCTRGGLGPCPKVRFVYAGSDTFPWGSGPTVDILECIIFSGHVVAPEPSTWWGRVLFTTRLEIAARAPRLHTVVRGTPVLGYRQ
jgi:hypothetical protein